MKNVRDSQTSLAFHLLRRQTPNTFAKKAAAVWYARSTFARIGRKQSSVSCKTHQLMESSATTCSFAPASGTAPPVALVVQGPRQHYSFSYDDLQAWPDSMLARAVVDTATDSDEAAPAPVVWQLQSVPKCPLTAWPEAAAVVHSLYKHQYITPDLMTTVLEGAAGKAAQHYKEPYQRLAELLSYLDLPGPVSRWLPPISLVRISHFNVLTFLFNFKELEYDYKVKVLAEQAVMKMLSYQPYGAAAGSTESNSGVLDNQGMRLAAFAIAFDACKTLDEPLRVYAVDDARQHLAARYDKWLEGLKAGKYSEADRDPIALRERFTRERDLQFVELTHGTFAPLSSAKVGVHQLVGSYTVPPGSPHQLVGHIKAAFGRLAGGTALTLLDFIVELVGIVPTGLVPRHQLRNRTVSTVCDIPLWAVCW